MIPDDLRRMRPCAPPGVGPAFARAFVNADRAIFGMGVDVERSGLARYDGDLPRFSTEVLGHKQWAFQKAVQRRLLEKRFVIICGPRSCSKTWTVAETVLGFMCTGPTMCLTTSGSGNQVKMGLWQKIRAQHASARVKLPGHPSGYKWEIAPEWFAYGFSSKNPGVVQGYHSSRELTHDAEEVVAATSPAVDGEPDAGGPMDEAFQALRTHVKRSERKRRKHRLLIVLDEAAEIPPEIIQRLEGSLLAPNVYVIAMCNPTFDQESDHPVARWWKEGGRWWRIHVASEEFDRARWEPEPADECFHGVPDEIQGAAEREELKKAYGGGIEMPLSRCFIYGLPASAESEFQIIPRRLLVACQDLELEIPSGNDQRHIGVDVAGQGKDKSAAALWVGGRLAALHEWKMADTMATVGVVLELMKLWGADGVPIHAHNVHVDATGIGRGVADRLRELGYYVDAVDFGSAPRYARRDLTGQFAFRNFKTELHWYLRRGLEEQVMCVPAKYRALWREAQWPTFVHHAVGKQTVLEMGESKDELREKFGASPDHLDAAVLGLARGGTGAGSIRVLNVHQRSLAALRNPYRR